MKIEKVMIVDDDSGIRRVAEFSLDRVGKWNVLAVESGMRALEVVADFQPDVILLDVMMAGLDGPTTFRMLRENESIASIPIIFLTAKVQKQEVQNYCQLGAVGVITKPFDPLTLPKEIMSLLDKTVKATCVA